MLIKGRLMKMKLTQNNIEILSDGIADFFALQ
jgi:hypothetical protein